jgi:predicted HicB family RNase H-like nuclease
MVQEFFKTGEGIEGEGEWSVKNVRIDIDSLKACQVKRYCWLLRSWRLNMPLKNDHYTYRVTWSEDDQEYVGLCTEFPSLSWLDQTPESALKGIREIVESVIKDMKLTDEEIPQPIAGKRYSGKFMVRVPPEVHRNLAMQASESGVSLNRIVGAKLSR